MRQTLRVSMLAIMTLALLNVERYHCCSEEEMIGLSEIKAWVNHPNVSSPDWVDRTQHFSCCEWNRVECEPTTKRVVKLNLFNMRPTFSRFEDFYLNASLFLPFKELRSLDLGSNGIVGCLKNQGFEVLASGLRKLEKLDLSYNTFNDSSLSSLRVLTSLKILDLAHNMLTTIPTGIHGLIALEELYLNGNIFNDSVLASMSGLSSLKILDLSYNMNLTGSNGINGLRNLKTLYLNGSDIKESILIESLAALPSLKTVSARRSNLSRTVVGKGFYNLTNLEELLLDHSSLATNFLLNIGALSNLEVLSLKYCDINGPLPAQGLHNMTKLEELLLDYTSLPTSFLQGIGALPALRILSLQQCELNGTLPDQGLCEMKNLEQLSLSQNKLQGILPSCLGNLSFLQILDLSHNQFVGNIAFSPLSHLTRLEFLSLSNNSFQVPVSFGSFMNHSHLKFLACDNNELIAASSFQPLAPKFQLQFFSASNCSSEPLKIEFPNFLYSQNHLSFLDLSHNNFFSTLFPFWLVENNRRLNQLHLRDTSLVGPLQLNFSNKSLGLSLEVLDISNNLLSGMLPRGIGNLSYLQAIDLSKNHFGGPIPAEFFKSKWLEFLDLSENNLSGSIPFSFNAPNLRHVHLYKNQLSGPLTHAFSNSSALVILDLRYNNLIGSIPNWIDSLLELSVLLLRANHFDGVLPVQICRLKNLSILDLSQNNFFGLLPSCLNIMASDDNPFFFSSSMGFLNDIFEIMGSTGEEYLKDKVWDLIFQTMGPKISFETVVEFTTKRNYYTYKNNILRYMSGIDLSCNRFTGEIPIELGNLIGIHALNLSHNSLTGPIPPSFSNLRQIESLDLSYNNLIGVIPMQFIDLTNLAVFNVSYNNLSGRTPEFKNQFGTFDESSYIGNPLLCGRPPLQNSCSEIELPSKRMSNDSNEDDGLIDMDSFYGSFAVSYISVVLTIAAVLCINPRWRCRWFYFIEECINTCYYFWVTNFRKLSHFRRL